MEKPCAQVPEDCSMQTRNRLFDDVARVAGGALGALSGLREELEILVRSRVNRILADMDLVNREEFEAVKAMAVQARNDADAMKKKLAEMERALQGVSDPKHGEATPHGGKGTNPGRKAADKPKP
ncbi:MULTISPECIES: accessory factor UbiK family protein [unclassified Haematospirillum]|uniref:accessory factor UbiK family protein n=1 Tax=unclassified Haematospirillum TaxID=2622088 RepID=UPI001FD78501|nr:MULTISPECIES: accessory factor UbiK family protein [unclassified Haematospirillum]